MNSDNSNTFAIVVGALGSAGLFTFLGKLWADYKSAKKDAYNGFMAKYDKLWDERSKEYERMSSKLDSIATELYELKGKYTALTEEKALLEAKVINLTAEVLKLTEERKAYLEREKELLTRIADLERVNRESTVISAPNNQQPEVRVRIDGSETSIHST